MNAIYFPLNSNSQLISPDFSLATSHLPYSCLVWKAPSCFRTLLHHFFYLISSPILFSVFSPLTGSICSCSWIQLKWHFFRISSKLPPFLTRSGSLILSLAATRTFYSCIFILICVIISLTSVFIYPTGHYMKNKTVTHNR